MRIAAYTVLYTVLIFKYELLLLRCENKALQNKALTHTRHQPTGSLGAALPSVKIAIVAWKASEEYHSII